MAALAHVGAVIAAKPRIQAMIQDAWLAFHRNNLWRLACRSDCNSCLHLSQRP